MLRFLFLLLPATFIACRSADRLTDSEHCRRLQNQGQESICFGGNESRSKTRTFLRLDKTLYFRHWTPIGQDREPTRREIISNALKRVDSSGVFRKLLLNEKTESLRNTMLRDLGFVHVLTAAGIHLYFLLSLIHWLLIKTPSHWFGNARNLKWVSNAVLCIVVFQCLYLSGFRTGFFRPILVFGVRHFARQNGMKWSSFSLLTSLAFIEALLFGWNQHGQIHYLLSVGGAWFAVFATREQTHPLLKTLLISWGSYIGVALWDVFFHGHVALAVPLLNLITYPLFIGLIYPAMILGSFLPNSMIESYYSGILFQSFDLVVDFLMNGVRSMSFNVWMIPFEHRLLFLLCFAALLVALLLIRIQNLRWGVVAVLLVFIGFRYWPTRNLGCDCAVQVEVLDVGQGDAMFVQYETRDKKILNGLIDVGRPGVRSASQWFRWAMERGVEKIDFMLLTHADQDHVGGLSDLSREVRVDCLVIPESEFTRVKTKWAQQYRLSDFKKGVDLKNEACCVPFPHQVVRHPNRRVKNNDSQIAWIFKDFKGELWMGAGDADSELELAAAPWFQDQLQKLNEGDYGYRNWFGSHHGSKNSGSEVFYRALGIDRLFVSSQWMGRYGHPHADFLTKAHKLGVQVYRTDRMGPLRLKKAMRIGLK